MCLALYGEAIKAKDSRAILRRGATQGRAKVRFTARDRQVLASQITAVTEQIKALTGFSYGELRRTVLLAQADFDAPTARRHQLHFLPKTKSISALNDVGLICVLK